MLLLYLLANLFQLVSELCLQALRTALIGITGILCQDVLNNSAPLEDENWIDGTQLG